MPNLARVVEGDVNDSVVVGLENVPPVVWHDIQVLAD
jgi:hypothetical protein